MMKLYKTARVVTAMMCAAAPTYAQEANYGGVPSVLFADRQSDEPFTIFQTGENAPLYFQHGDRLERLPSSIQNLGLTEEFAISYMETTGARPAEMRQDFRSFDAASSATHLLTIFDQPAGFGITGQDILQRLQNNDFVGIETLNIGYRNEDGEITGAIYSITRNDGTSLIVTTFTGPNGELVLEMVRGQFTYLEDGSGTAMSITEDQTVPCESHAPGDLQKSCYEQVVKVQWIGNLSTLGSGVFIHPDYVLTAAHVIRSKSGNSAEDRDIGLTQYQGGVERRYEVNGIQFIPGLDLAVLKVDLTNGVETEGTHSPMLSGQPIIDSTEFSIAGFGILPNGWPSNNLRWGLFKVVKAFSPENTLFHGEPIPIVGVADISSGCRSDSGAPAFASIGGSNAARLVVIGLFLGGKETGGNNCASASRFVNLTNPDTQALILAAIRNMGDETTSQADLTLTSAEGE